MKNREIVSSHQVLYFRSKCPHFHLSRWSFLTSPTLFCFYFCYLKHISVFYVLCSFIVSFSFVFILMLIETHFNAIHLFLFFLFSIIVFFCLILLLFETYLNTIFYLLWFWFCLIVFVYCDTSFIWNTFQYDLSFSQFSFFIYCLFYFDTSVI